MKTNVFARAWNTYNELLLKRPLLTKAITSGVISAIADVLSQKFFTPPMVNKTPNSSEIENISQFSQFDTHRFFKFSLLGLVLVGPTLHFWYTTLSSLIPGQQIRNVVARLVLDQFVFSPIFICVFMSSVVSLDYAASVGMEGIGNNTSSLSDLIKQKLNESYVDTLAVSYSVWIPAMLLNFRFVPVHMQTLFSNGVGLLWNTYLSYVSYKDT